MVDYSIMKDPLGNEFGLVGSFLGMLRELSEV